MSGRLSAANRGGGLGALTTRRHGHFSPFASFMSSRPSCGWPSNQDGSDEQMVSAK